MDMCAVFAFDNPKNPFTPVGAKWQLKDFTLSNDRRIYSGTPCHGLKGLKH